MSVREEPAASQFLRPRWDWFSSALGPFLGLFAVVLVFYLADQARAGGGRFATLDSLRTVAMQTSGVGVAALGMLVIIIAGGIDLSVGSAIALCATVAAWCFTSDWPVAAALAATLCTGCLAGLCNGTLISLLRVVPFIVTLGTMTVFRGAGRIIAGDTPIRAHGKAPEWLLNMQVPDPVPEWLVVSPGVWLMLALAGGVAAVLHLTVFGRHVFALGSSEATARLCGISVGRTRVAVYTLAGVFVGVAGLFQFAVLDGEGDPMAGAGKELEVIAAVVIGGGSLSGGRGSVLGTLSGAAIMAVIDHGCTILGIPDPWQDVIIGAIIVTAVALDQVRGRRLNR